MTRSQQSILVTGGAGFIGSNFILHWLAQEDSRVVNLDKLTYAGNPANLAELNDDSRYVFARGDINDSSLVSDLLQRHQPAAIIHFAAESHVDRSIHNAQEFIRTNIEGTFVLLQAARQYWAELAETEKQNFRFLHVSTDEVYGSLGPDGPGLHGENPVRSQQSLCGVKSFFRPSGKSVSSHVWTANTHYELLQQLRPLPVSRKADSADDPQCDDGKAFAGVWRRIECAGLAVCKRPL